MGERCVMQSRGAIKYWVGAIAIVLIATMPLADAAEHYETALGTFESVLATLKLSSPL